MGSLLLHLVGSRQEDSASAGLVYVLHQSPEARKALGDVLGISDGENIVYSSQDTGDKQERPDIVGRKNGKEIVIIEAKFWAGLTENQPVTYLERLKKTGGELLAFICPQTRIKSLQNEIESRKKEIERPELNDIPMKCFAWLNVLTAIKNQLGGNSQLLSDVGQIIELCNAIEDTTELLPLNEEDMAPELGRKVMAFCQIIDNIIDNLVNKKNKRADLKNGKLMATPQRWGYTRYFNCDEFGCTLNVDFELWKGDAGTYFAFAIHSDIDESKEWIYSEGFMRKRDSFIQRIKQDYPGAAINDKWGVKKKVLYIPLKPRLHVTADIVADKLADEILAIMDKAKEYFK